VVEPKHDDRANDGYEHTVEIGAGEPGRADGCEEVSAHHGADDPKDKVKQQALTSASNEVAGHEPGHQSQKNPA
jgi:hypothetical protein